MCNNELKTCRCKTSTEERDETKPLGQAGHEQLGSSVKNRIFSLQIMSV